MNRKKRNKQWKASGIRVGRSDPGLHKAKKQLAKARRKGKQ